MDILHRTKPSKRWLLLAFSLLVFQPSTLTAQTGVVTNEFSQPAIAVTPNAKPDSAQQFVEQGKRLESTGSWGDALSLSLIHI